jgi:hypothetical protein
LSAIPFLAGIICLLTSGGGLSHQQVAAHLALAFFLFRVSFILAFILAVISAVVAMVRWEKLSFRDRLIGVLPLCLFLGFMLFLEILPLI